MRYQHHRQFSHTGQQYRESYAKQTCLNAKKISGKKKKKITIEPQILSAISSKKKMDKAKSTSNWKTPGIERVFIFWLKILTSSNDQLAVTLGLRKREQEATPN